MANPEHVALLKQGVAVWNNFCRGSNAPVDADLNHQISLFAWKFCVADLVAADLAEVHLAKVYLVRANLERAILLRANLIQADLRGANLRGAKLIDADLRSANLIAANLINAELRGADLGQANLAKRAFTVPIYVQQTFAVRTCMRQIVVALLWVSPSLLLQI